MGFSGREMIEAMVRGEVPPPPMASHLGLRLTDVGDGYAEMRVRHESHHANAGGVAHGGLAAAMIDSVTGCALWTEVPDGQRIATVELGVTYIRAVGSEVDELVATGTVVHLGGSIGVANGEVRDADGTLYATGRATYAVLRPDRDSPGS